MNTLTLCRRACGDPEIRRKFGGVFPSDVLPRRKCHFSLYVVNLDPQTKPGSHWIGIHFSNRIAYYFDSYGNVPTNANILSFLKRNSDRIMYNPACFQSKVTDTCGHYCLYFLHRRARHLKLTDLIESEKKKNERFITRFVTNRLKPSKCCHKRHAKRQSCKAWINMRSSNKPAQCSFKLSRDGTLRHRKDYRI